MATGGIRTRATLVGDEGSHQCAIRAPVTDRSICCVVLRLANSWLSGCVQSFYREKDVF